MLEGKSRTAERHWIMKQLMKLLYFFMAVAILGFIALAIHLHRASAASAAETDTVCSALLEEPLQNGPYMLVTESLSGLFHISQGLSEQACLCLSLNSHKNPSTRQAHCEIGSVASGYQSPIGPFRTTVHPAPSAAHRVMWQ